MPVYVIFGDAGRLGPERTKFGLIAVLYSDIGLIIRIIYRNGAVEAEAFVPSTISTVLLPPGERFAIWREAFAAKVAGVEASTPDPGKFSAGIRFQPLPGLTISKNIVGPCRLMRGAAQLRDGDDGASLVVCLQGRARALFGDR